MSRGAFTALFNIAAFAKRVSRLGKREVPQPPSMVEIQSRRDPNDYQSLSQTVGLDEIASDKGARLSAPNFIEPTASANIRIPSSSNRSDSAPIWPEAYDGEYEDFVECAWQHSTIDLNGIAIECDGKSAELISLTDVNRTYLYVNLWRAYERLTLASDRHEWTRKGCVIDSSAFLAIAAGLPVDVALRFDPYPITIEDAKAKDRLETSERRLLIRYRNLQGQESWRVLSRVRHSREHMTARCHFRWGVRRTFLYDQILEIVDHDSGEFIYRKYFLKYSTQPKRKERTRKSLKK